MGFLPISIGLVLPPPWGESLRDCIVAFLKEGTSIPFMDEVDAKYGGRNAHLIGAGGAIGLGTLAAGGLGGQIGGGNANIGNMLGIAGMQPNTIVDPEAYGSSNLRVY